ncbi:site-2 protease family protein [Clostridium saccharoperbutylacetonicum]|uniref:site-2 protease family protein n=1 Tax=Clostridium saccharoperbutylacetonicum TaxID=36745 RepID=UPI0039EA70F6
MDLLNLNTSIYDKIVIIPALIVAFTVHEFAHAFVADKLGDKTPRFQGRVTLNPAAHLDPIGFILAVFFIFGWAKPVQTNPSAYKNPSKDSLKVSLAGPISNFIVAIIATVIYALFIKIIYFKLSEGVAQVLHDMIFYILSVNISIGLFNLIPVPPLDGFKIIKYFKPKIFYEFQDKFYQYQPLILIALILFGGRIIGILSTGILNFLLRLVSIVLHVF